MTVRQPSVDPNAFRQKRNLLLAYATEAISPALRAAASIRSRSAPTLPAAWRRGLILSHTHIGDLLYRTPSLKVLAEQLPECRWSYATSSQSAEVLSNNPHISEVLPVVQGENSWNLAPGGYAELASREFDVVLCTNTLRHHPDLALAAALGIPSRYGFSGKGLSGLMTSRVPLPFPSSYPSYFQRMVADVTGTSPDWPLRPRLYPAEEHRVQADAILDRSGLDRSQPIVVCSLRTRQAAGNWPADVILSVLERARSQRDFGIVFSGAPVDARFLGEVASAFPFPAATYAGEGGLLTFAAMLERCGLLLTLDSGPRHIGNAMGIPVVFARNLAHSRVEAGIYCATETDLAPAVEYLGHDETERTARAQSIGQLAGITLDRLSRSGTQA